MAVTGVSLATALGVNGAVCLVAILVFAYLRVSKVARKFYAPKRFDPEVKLKPKRLPLSFFAWIRPVLKYPEDEILFMSGMDVVVFLRLLNYGFVLFAFCTFWCCGLLLPINITAGYLGTMTSSNFSDLDLMSVSNLAPSDPRMWAHLASAYVVTLFALWLLYAFSKDISKLRARYLSSLPRGGESHTVLITDIPGLEQGSFISKTPLKAVASMGTKAVGSLKPSNDEQAEAGGALPVMELPPEVLDPWASARADMDAHGDMHALVEKEMKAVYGAEHVAAVNVVYNTSKVDPLLAKYDAQKQALDDLNNDYIAKIKRREEIKKRKEVSLLPALTPAWAKERYSVGAKPVKVDALEYMPLNLDKLKQQMEEERAAIKSSYLPAAFVTFNDRYTQTLASTGLHSYDEQCWRTQPAPGSEEILWGNLGMTYWTRVVRTVGMWGVFVALLIFYLPLTAAIQAVVNLKNVEKVPGLGLVTKIPFVTQVLEGILPGLVLKIFLAIVPMILGIMAKIEGKVSLSEVDFSVVNKFFIFQVFATFIYQFVVGSALSQMSVIINEGPSAIIQLLGVSAAQQANFFMSFIMIAALAIGMGLLRLVPFIIFLVRQRLAGTEKAKYRLWAKQYFQFGPNVANHTIIMLLGLAFCCLAPLIAPFCLMYFSLATMAQRYQLIYVLTRHYEATGRMWMNCFTQIMVGIYFLQAMVVCVLGVKKFGFVLLIIPLPFITILFHLVVGRLFRRPWTLMSLKEAAILDGREPNHVTPEEAAWVKANYVNPAFKVDEAEHQALISNAASVDARLKGTGDLHLVEDEVQRIDSEAF